ncbi:MAG: RNA polymerase sigma factor [Candidatus Cloacimonadales bacterium]|nr:RNA polymerase sigma factor [Candidatus Cloacimonadales bacterium]
MDIELRKKLEKRCLQIIPTLQKQIRKYITDYNDQSDILQDTMVSALKNITDLAEPYNVEGWIMTIIKNKCMAWLKSRNKMSYLPDSANIPYIASDTDENLTMDEYEQLIQGINQLSYPLRNVIQMKYFTHNSVKDISKLLQLPEGIIKRRLHDARKKLKKEFGMETSKTAPKIRIIEKPQEQKSIKRLGFGLNFGSPLAGVGDVEVYEAYEFPGRIFINKFSSEVTRKARIMEKEVLEVRDKSILKQEAPEKYFYYHLEDNVISMPFRIMNFPQNLKIDIDQDELLSPQKCKLSTGKYQNSKDNETGIIDLVDLTIGDKTIKSALRERYSSDDFHGRCYMEKYYNQEGREILHRNYIGQNWKMGDYITWNKWKDSPEVEFEGEKFRLWFEFVLVDNYRKEEK